MFRKIASFFTMSAAAIVILLGASVASQAQSKVSAYSSSADSLMQVYASKLPAPTTGTIFITNGNDWFYGTVSKLAFKGNLADVAAQGYLSSGGQGSIVMHLTADGSSSHCSYQVKNSRGVRVASLCATDFYPVQPGFIAIY